MPDQTILTTVKQYLLDRFLPGEDPSQLTDDAPLITGGILDSLGTLELVSFLEKTYGVEFEAHEVDPQRLDTLSSIAGVVRAKTGAQA